jgi:monofunctional glycosyltransferase
VLSFFQVVAVRFINPRITIPTILHWAADKLHIAEEPFFKPKQTWRSMREISPYLRRAVLAAEDQRFLQHRGFDFHEMAKSFDDILSSKRIRGASTISMQTARTVFLWPDRTLFRKIFEAWYTLLLEILWSKSRILEVYLNTVDWGGPIMGAETASRYYFRVSSDELSRHQAASLAAVLPAPGRWSPTRPTEYVQSRIQRILSDMDKVPLIR